MVKRYGSPKARRQQAIGGRFCRGVRAVRPVHVREERSRLPCR